MPDYKELWCMACGKYRENKGFALPPGVKNGAKRCPVCLETIAAKKAKRE